MKFLTLTQNRGATTIYVNEAQIVSFTAGGPGGTGATISTSVGGPILVDQSPAAILAML
jgi:hypothetical protein